MNETYSLTWAPNHGSQLPQTISACSIAAPKNWYDVTSGANHILRHIAYMIVLVKLENTVRFKYKGRFTNTCFFLLPSDR